MFGANRNGTCIRVFLEKGLKGLVRLNSAPDGGERLSELFVGIREPRVLPDSLLKKRDRFFKLALLGESTSQVLRKRREVGGVVSASANRRCCISACPRSRK